MLPVPGLRLFPALAFPLLAACGDPEGAPPIGQPDAGASAAPDAAEPLVRDAPRGQLIYELRQPVPGDGAPIASDNYFCTRCPGDADAAAAFVSEPLPPGMHREIRTIHAARITLFPPLNSRGAPERLDVFEGIEGEESHLGAQPLFGEIIDGVAVRVTMESTRRIEWDAGDSTWELFDGEDAYLLFAVAEDRGAPPPEEQPLPDGWSRRERTFDEPFVLPERERVTVFLQLAAPHLWQRLRFPEP